MNNILPLIFMITFATMVSAQEPDSTRYEYMELETTSCFSKNRYKFDCFYVNTPENEHESLTLEILDMLPQKVTKMEALNYLADFNWEILDFTTYHEYNVMRWSYLLRRKVPIKNLPVEYDDKI